MQMEAVSGSSDIPATDSDRNTRAVEGGVEPAKPLVAYVLDLPAAVKLCRWVRQSLGAYFNTLGVINASSLVALSKKLVSKC